MPDLRRLEVAIIGAGAAGLATAAELAAAGHTPTVFEQAPEPDGPGGVWVYTPQTEEEGGGRGGGGGGGRPSSVHSSMYAGLRTNLPRHLMSFPDFPFEPGAMGGGGGGSPGTASTDPRTYPGHAEVRAYLAAYASFRGLLGGGRIRFGCAVTAAEPVEAGEDASAGRPPLPWPRWRVAVRRGEGGAGREEASAVFDALAVASGHFAVPRRPEALAIDPAWPGPVLHSHDYRAPTAGRLGAALAAAGGPGGAVVAVLGAGPSGEDLARELSPHVASVLLCSAAWDAGRAVPRGEARNVVAAPWVTAVAADGTPTFAAGDAADGPDPPDPPPRLAALVLATGYRYSFPFLPPSVAAAPDNEVLPHLADHLFPPAFAPGLALIGLPFKVVPFPLFTAQARRFGAALSGAAPLSAAAAAARAAAQAASRAAAGIPSRHAHCLSGDRQWAYMEALVAEAGGGGLPGGGGGSGPGPSPFMPPWRAALYDAASAARKADPDGYRDDASSGVFTGAAAAEAGAWAAGWKG